MYTTCFRQAEEPSCSKQLSATGLSCEALGANVPLFVALYHEHHCKALASAEQLQQVDPKYEKNLVDIRKRWHKSRTSFSLLSLPCTSLRGRGAYVFNSGLLKS